MKNYEYLDPELSELLLKFRFSDLNCKQLVNGVPSDFRFENGMLIKEGPTVLNTLSTIGVLLSRYGYKYKNDVNGNTVTYYTLTKNDELLDVTIAQFPETYNTHKQNYNFVAHCARHLALEFYNIASDSLIKLNSKC